MIPIGNPNFGYLFEDLNDSNSDLELGLWTPIFMKFRDTWELYLSHLLWAVWVGGAGIEQSAVVSMLVWAVGYVGGLLCQPQSKKLDLGFFRLCLDIRPGLWTCWDRGLGLGLVLDNNTVHCSAVGAWLRAWHWQKLQKYVRQFWLQCLQANRRSTLDYDLVSHRIFSRNRGLFSGEDVMILYIHILIHLIA